MSSGLSQAEMSDGFYKISLVVLSPAQIKLLNASPAVLVPTPGPNKVIEFLGAMLFLDYKGTVYTESADNLVIEYASGTDVSDSIEMTGFIDATADACLNVRPKNGVALAINSALRLLNANDEFAAGNSPLFVSTAYRIHDLDFNTYR
jgi:hypothetical protein